MTAPRVLVIGADNYIGSRIVAALRAGGDFTPVAADRRKPVTPDALHGVHGIVNAATGNRRVIRAQAHAAGALARAAGDAVRLVHLSSMTVYGARDRVVNETAAPIADLGAYAAAQIEAERTVQAHPNTVILRPGCEYGPGCEAWSGRIAQLLNARRLGDLGTAGDGYCNLVYIDDLVDAVVESLRRPAIGGEIFNLAMRMPPRWNEYLIRFGIALRAVPIRRIPARTLRLEAKVMAPLLKLIEIGARRLGHGRGRTAPPLTSSLLRLCRQEIILVPDKAETVLGIRWTPLDEGIARAAAAERPAISGT